MTKSLFFIVSLMFSIILVQGQSNQKPGSGGDLLKQLQEDDGGDPIQITVDSLLEANYYKFMTMNRKASGIPGFRIRIFSESGLGAKEKQQRARAKFLSFHPDIDAYYRYDEPFFKVYVGDCRTKSEALKLNDDIEKNFPNTIIVPDFINIKKIE